MHGKRLLASYIAPPKTAVWFIKPRNTVIRHGEPIPYPQGEKVLAARQWRSLWENRQPDTP